MYFLKKFLPFCIYLFCLTEIFGLDFNIRVTPAVIIPAGDSTSSLFSPGGGVFLNTEIELFSTISTGPEFGYFVTPLLNTGTYPNIRTAGLGSSYYNYPLSRLALNIGASGGIYDFQYTDYSYSNLWWKIYGEAGFRLSPHLILSGGAGFINFNAASEPLYSGILAGISARYSFSTSASSGNVTTELEQYEPVFPLLYGIYNQNSIGTITVTNRESAEIKNISVSFRADNYTASLMYCGSIDMLRKNAFAQVPLYADFSESIQNFTEKGMIRGELVIRYELLGTERTANQTVSVPVYNRNTVRWGDPAVLASFISPNSPEVMDYSKYIVGLARNNLRTGLNRNMQFAMYLFEGLRAGGISYSADDTTPYLVYHKDPLLIDYIQYPFQTLSYRLGDYDDLGILFSAVLESVGIKTALIPLENDFIAVFSLEINQQQAENLFYDTDKLLAAAGEIWMPLSLTVMREGFINSWHAAVNSLNKAFGTGENINFIILQDAWTTYPPSGIKGQEAAFPKPQEAIVNRAVETNMRRYIASEFGPRIQTLQNEIKTTGASTGLYNQLGLLYVRAGLYNEAKAEFIKSADLKSDAAMVNLGNIEMLERNYESAGIWFKKALELQPDNRAALNGIERVNLQLME